MFCDWINVPQMAIKYCMTGVRFYNASMINSSGILNAANRDSRSVTAIRERTSHPVALSTHCLWCGRAFTPRATGGSAQKFCSTEHRQDFWIAARRWTIRAIDAGLLSVDCLKELPHERARCLRGVSVDNDTPW